MLLLFLFLCLFHHSLGDCKNSRVPDSEADDILYGHDQLREAIAKGDYQFKGKIFPPPTQPFPQLVSR